MSDERINPEAEAAVAKVRRLMTIASATTVLAVAAVLGVIGYRVFHLQGSAPPALETAPALPAGAKVLSSAVGDGRIVLTVEVNGAIALYSFDLNTLKPLGHAVLSPKPQ